MRPIFCILLAFLCVGISLKAKAQRIDTTSASTTPISFKQNKRLQRTLAIQGALWTGSLLALNQAWYADYPRSRFHLFNDFPEWHQMDKLGHAYTGYLGTGFSYAAYRHAGLTEKQSAWYGAASGLAFLSVIEILDGFSTAWGFSPPDMLANITGTGLFTVQQLAWHEQRIQLKVSAHRQFYRDPELEIRANQFFGATTPQRLLKDYNAQTYWLSFNPRLFGMPKPWPQWLLLSAGYGAENMLGGRNNTWKDPQGIQHDRRDLPRLRQFYFAPDIDLSKIKIKGKTPKLLKAFQYITLKFPLPALEINSAGQVKFHAISF
ncbi:MAG: DUF2279 domain-containing protein [Chitinophagaceae bacterium]|nr:DUF2279 domain-containing protein [Chitinophagaceae bacterium]